MKRIRQAIGSEWGVLAGITVLAALLRFVAIDRLPPGLYHDEAYNGLDALAVLAGDTPVFFAANNGREPLFIYLLAPGVALFGATPGALRIVSALLGTLTVPATYWMGREMLGRRVGLLAAWLAAVTVWTLNLSRVAFRAVSMPLVVALTLALLWRALSARRAGRYALAGAAYGLTFYTYLAARFAPLALLAFLGYLALGRRDRLWWRGWLAFGAAALVVAAPLGAYLLSHWGETAERAGQVAVWNPAIHGGDLPGTLARHVWRTAGALFVRGDTIPRHNVPGRPVFDPLVGAAAVLGAGVALRRWREPACAFALIWVGAMLLPTVLAEDAPHYLRASGALPLVFLLPAVGLDAAWRHLAARRGPFLGSAAAALVVGYATWAGPHAYFRHLRGEAAYYNYESAAAELAAEVNRFLGAGWRGAGLSAPARPVNAVNEDPPARTVYLAPRLWEHWASVRYLCAEAARSGAVSTDPERLAAAASEDVLLVLWPFEDPGAAPGLLPRGRPIIVEEGAHERGDLEAESRLLYVTMRSADPAGVPSGGVVGRWEGGIELLGYEMLALDGGRTAVDLYWRATRPLGAPYSVFVHLLEGGILAAQDDGPAAGGYYGTERWRAGDVVRDRHVVSLDLSSQGSAAYDVRVGLYRWETMEHLSLLDASGRPTGVTSLTLGP